MKIKDIEIITPDYAPLIKKLQSLSSMNLYFINRYQQQKRFFPESNAGCEDYCLYLGSMEETLKKANGEEYKQKCDLWHYPYYRSRYPMYSTAIIVGNEGGDYLSGWASLSVTREAYRMLLRREVICGLVDDPKIIMDVGLAVLNLRADMSEVQYNKIINEAAGGVDSHKYYEEDEGHYHKSDWWVEHWWGHQIEEKFNEN